MFGRPIEGVAKNSDRVPSVVKLSIADRVGEQPHFQLSHRPDRKVRNKRVYFGRIDNFVYRNRDNVKSGIRNFALECIGGMEGERE